MNGTLIINKPEDWTSHDVVAKLRGILGTRRIGHAGTLDPFATGVLVVCVGVATRLVQFLVGLDKKYIATVRLGFATDTQDYTGKPITPLVSSKEVTAEEIRKVLNDFTGRQMQLPPIYSAKKIGGQRLHQAARQGREVERQAVAITLYSIELLNEAGFMENADGTKDFKMRVHCSSGTYIRTLATDIGARLGVAAHLAALQRTSVAQFTIAESLRLDEVEARHSAGLIGAEVIGLAETVSHLPILTLDCERIKWVTNGRQLTLPFDETEALTEDCAGDSQVYVRLCNELGELVAIGEFFGLGGIIKPKTVFVVQGN
jgi:tRNA pseudouridine55 synthase